MLVRALPVLLCLNLLVGCAQEDDTGSKAPPINQGDDTAEVVCEGAAPVITDLVIENGGIQDFEGTDSPTLKVSATATDDDADLHRMNLILWWDDVVDGAVDTSGAGTESDFYAMDPDPCATDEATLGLLFQVEGNRFAYGTAYEFAAKVQDDAGLTSEVFVNDGVAPNEDGSDG